jgi:hypothetical protein
MAKKQSNQNIGLDIIRLVRGNTLKKLLRKKMEMSLEH